jgi:hypothetical protein
MSATSVRPARTPVSRVGIASAAIAGSVTVLYLVIIVAQGDAAFVSTAIVAGGLAALTATVAIGATRSSASARLPWLGAATGGLIGLGVASLLSIGALMLVAGGLAVAAWVGASDAAGRGHARERAYAVGLALLTPAVLLGLILAT